MRLYTDPNDNARLHVDGERRGGYVLLSQAGALVSVPLVHYPAFLEAARALLPEAEPLVCVNCGAPVVYDDGDGWRHATTLLGERYHAAVPMHPTGGQ